MIIDKHWDKKKYAKFIEKLKVCSDEKYKAFNQKLILNSKYEILGVRIPELRRIAKEIYKTTNYKEFIEIDNEKYMEEVLIKGFVIGHIKSQEETDNYIKSFIYKIDNWCICDTFCNSLKIVNKNKEKYFNFFTKEIDISINYGIRTSLVVLNSFYVENKYIHRILNYVDSINNDYYYVSMGIAWLLSTCYIKCRKETEEYLKNNTLSDFTYNKTIQKIIESNRVDIKTKNILRQMKR